MRENGVKRRLREGGIAIGSMVMESRSGGIAEILASAGFDFMFIDMEHTSMNMETAAEMVRAARLSGIAPIVRPPDLQYHLMTRPLDAGAMGLMIPRVEDVSQVEEALGIVRFPPQGRRGLSLSGGHTGYRPVDGAEFVKAANSEILMIIQIESERAVQNIEALVSVEGVDVAFVGPNDLSASIGLPGQGGHPEVVRLIEKVVEACQEAGMAAGLQVGRAPSAVEWIKKGVRMVSVSSDLRMIMNSATSIMKELEPHIKG